MDRIFFCAPDDIGIRPRLKGGKRNSSRRKGRNGCRYVRAGLLVRFSSFRIGAFDSDGSFFFGGESFDETGLIAFFFFILGVGRRLPGGAVLLRRFALREKKRNVAGNKKVKIRSDEPKGDEKTTLEQKKKRRVGGADPRPRFRVGEAGPLKRRRRTTWNKHSLPSAPWLTTVSKRNVSPTNGKSLSKRPKKKR